jgi:hypothetical protein
VSENGDPLGMEKPAPELYKDLAKPTLAAVGNTLGGLVRWALARVDRALLRHERGGMATRCGRAGAYAT